MKLYDLPLEIISIIVDFVIARGDDVIEVCFESNIKNLCSLELVSSVWTKHSEIRKKLDECWKIIFYEFVGVEFDDDGKILCYPMNSLQTFDYFLEEGQKKGFKRCFGLVKEYERKVLGWKPPKTITIAIGGVGESGVSSFIHRYLHDQFGGGSTAKSFHKSIEIDDQILNFQFNIVIADRITGKRPKEKLKDVFGVVYICDISENNVHYLNILEHLIRDAIFSNTPVYLPVLFCLNKIDLVNSESDSESNLTISQLEELAKKNVCNNYEVVKMSAKDNFNVNLAMEKIIKKAYFTSRRTILDVWRRKETLVEVIELDDRILERNKKCTIV